ncbi:MAG: NAD(P)/FAD-dependent oxidoreductase [bacterium]|nr:NAD(P)/FAD-dependent oxidoreductase [bacterium]
MRVAIVGAGFTGLAVAYKLSRLGHEVVVFEKEDKPGGLAIGFKDPKWSWALEAHYHHLFTSDNSIRDLAKEVGHEIIFTTPKTSTLYNGEIHKLDTPLSLLKFPYFSLLDKFRAGVTLLYLRTTSDWRFLEKEYARDFLLRSMGKRVWEVLWEPLFSAKFGRFADKVTAAWFFARIKKRSASLGYPEGGFQKLAESIQQAAEKNGATFVFDTSVEKIQKTRGGISVWTQKDKSTFDTLIFTLPTFLFLQIARGLPEKYKNSVQGLEGLGAVNLVLSLNMQFLKDGTYWLNINDKGYPFLAVVEHTNFMEKNKYAGDRLLYVGNYLEKTHPYFGKSASELLREFMPHLKKINPQFEKSWVKKAWKFSAPFAQPVAPLNYSKKVPKHKTPLSGVILANMQQVYPWDRGTNYAVEMGGRIADEIHKKALG